MTELVGWHCQVHRISLRVQLSAGRQSPMGPTASSRATTSEGSHYTAREAPLDVGDLVRVGFSFDCFTEERTVIVSRLSAPCALPPTDSPAHHAHDGLQCIAQCRITACTQSLSAAISPSAAALRQQALSPRPYAHYLHGLRHAAHVSCPILVSLPA